MALVVLTALVTTIASMIVSLSATASAHADGGGESVALAPAGSASRQPFVAAAKRQAALPRQTPSERWLHSATPVPACAPAKPGAMTCYAIGRGTGLSFGASAKAAAAGPAVNSPSSPGFTGYLPADIEAAYGTTGTTGTPLVAIVDPFDDPSAESDLAQYRSTFGLPACTTANGCFTKVDQSGGTDYPPADASSSVEISLDLDAVSAACPGCHILLVEATSSNSNDLFSSVAEAAKLGARYVSMSWGTSEGSVITDLGAAEGAKLVQAMDSEDLSASGVTYVAATGDDAYRYDATTEPLGGLSYPASSPDVVAAGGVALDRDPTTDVFSDTAWSWDPSTIGCMYTQPFSDSNRCAGAGSGCSMLEPAQTWQQSTADLAAVCPGGRAGADVSADADPNTGLLIDDDGQAGEVGGTSLAAPLITALYAASGETAGSVGGAVQSLAYAGSSGMTDVTTGSTGDCGNALCVSGLGWDGPTGLGTPTSPASLFTKAASTVSVSWPAFRYGTAATVRVTVSASVAPTGTLRLAHGSKTLASAKLSGTGKSQTASLSVPGTALVPGSNALTISYSGNPDVVAKTAAAHTVTVAKATPTVTTHWPSFRYGAASTVAVSVRATVAPLASGTITLKWGTKKLATAHLPSGSAKTKTVHLTVHTSTLTAGRRPLTVGYSGDTDVAAKTAAAHTVTVAKANPTVTASWPKTIHFAKPFSVKITVRAGGTVSGTVSVKLGSKVLKSVRLPGGTAASKTATITIAARRVPRGTRKLTVHYGGDANVNALQLGAHTVHVT